MENICRCCGKEANTTCICDNNLFFCYKHMIKHMKSTEGQHESFDLKKIRKDFIKTCKSKSRINK